MPPIPLPKNHLHLWTVPYNPEDASTLDYFREILLQDLLDRSTYFEFPEKQHEYLISQGMLRVLLGKYLDKEPTEVELGRHSKGKPYCREDESLCFNMSNTSGLSMFGFARGQEVGVDVEEIRDLPEIDELIEANFKESEIRQINKDPEQKRQMFFRFWTFKESYLKAIGEGMRLPPENLEFKLEKEQVKLISTADVFADEDWSFHEIASYGGYTGTITYKGAQTRIVEKQFDLQEMKGV